MLEQTTYGQERRVVVDGSYSSVAEHWHSKPKALGSTPGSSTFFLALSPFQRSTESNGMIGSLVSASCKIRTIVM